MRAIHVPARTTFGFLIVSSLSLQPASVSEATRVGTTGGGPIRFGMSVSQAARASGLELVPVHDPLGPDERVDCYYVKSQSGPPDVTFMIADGKVARIEVSNRNVLTISGARIGMLENEILKLYTNRVKVTQHPYDPSGHYLTIFPHAPRRLVFATDGRVVTDFVAGKAPEVDFVEGCL